MRSNRCIPVALPSLLLLLWACGPVDEEGAGASVFSRLAATRPVPPVPQQILVRAFDYQYDAPDTIGSGPTTIRLINDGPEPHHLYLVRLEGGRTLQDLMQHLAGNHGVMPYWAVDVGGPSTPGAPGEETNATLDLEPGEYAILCVVPSPDGTPHIGKGMARPLTVVERPPPLAAMPAADVVMTLYDYGFRMDRPITAGRRTIRFENTAVQSHEVVFVRLAPGRTVQDFLRFLRNPAGAPPGKPIGGITNIARGEVNLAEIEFEAGDYGLLCFTPDAMYGMSHVELGMVDQFHVR
jgi:plastocyanin